MPQNARGAFIYEGQPATGFEPGPTDYKSGKTHPPVVQIANLGQHCLVSFASLLTGLEELASRDQSPICSRSSHWRNSPLKPPLSATSSRIRDVEFDLQNLSIIEQHDLFTKSFIRDKRPATNWSASLASTSGREFAQSGNYSQGIRLIATAQRIRRKAKISITNPQKFLPLPDVAFEADASGNLET